MVKNARKSMPTFVLLALLVVGGILLNVVVSNVLAAVATHDVKIQTTVADAISLSCDKDTTTPVDLGTLTPGSPVTGSTICTVNTNAANGYDLAVKNVSGLGYTLNTAPTGSTSVMDKTAWDSTASAGSGNAAVWAGTGMAFTVFASTANKNTTWWGTGSSVSDVNNKYAGLPTTFASAAIIMSYGSYSSAATTTSIGFKLDVPATQKSGAYSGAVTFQATSKP